jgi:hypothetical protein
VINRRGAAVPTTSLTMTEPNPETLRTYAARFGKMLPSPATTAAAGALRLQADETERQKRQFERDCHRTVPKWVVASLGADNPMCPPQRSERAHLVGHMPKKMSRASQSQSSQTDLKSDGSHSLPPATQTTSTFC